MAKKIQQETIVIITKKNKKPILISDIVDPPLDIIYEKYPAYKILARNEIVKKGDEYYCNNAWYKTNAPGGFPVYHKYRRRVKK